MDITNLNFRTYAERVIRKIMEHVKNHPAIIGYQVDNETKHYNTIGPNIQQLFVQYMKEKYKHWILSIKLSALIIGATE